MPKKPSPTTTVPTDDKATIRIPVSSPRNRVAQNLLLRKSTAHADKRKRAEAQQANTELRLAKKTRLEEV